MCVWSDVTGPGDHSRTASGALVESHVRRHVESHATASGALVESHVRLHVESLATASLKTIFPILA
jgi:hypothetical protein